MEEKKRRVAKKGRDSRTNVPSPDCSSHNNRPIYFLLYYYSRQTQIVPRNLIMLWHWSPRPRLVDCPHISVTRENKPTIRAAIFDMDGLLLDTESLAMTSCLETGVELGFDISEQLFLSVVGRDAKATRGIFADSLGADFSFDTFQTHWRKNFEVLIGENGIPKKTGSEELLQMFGRRSLPMAVATSTGKDKAVEHLLATGIRDHFYAVIAGTRSNAVSPRRTSSSPRPDDSVSPQRTVWSSKTPNRVSRPLMPPGC